MALVSVELVLSITKNGMESRYEAPKGIAFRPWICKRDLGNRVTRFNDLSFPWAGGLSSRNPSQGLVGCSQGSESLFKVVTTTMNFLGSSEKCLDQVIRGGVVERHLFN